jgi:hypothetical protein
MYTSLHLNTLIIIYCELSSIRIGLKISQILIKSTTQSKYGMEFYYWNVYTYPNRHND